jgi:hypothetical protein
MPNSIEVLELAGQVLCIAKDTVESSAWKKAARPCKFPAGIAWLRQNSRPGLIDWKQAYASRKSMTDFGKLLIFFGFLLFVAGIVLVLLGRTPLPLGRLPGDIIYRGKSSTFYFPLATSILLSVVLSVLLYVVSRWRR